MEAEPDEAGSQERTPPGHAAYTALFLKVYDPLVLGFYSRRVWRCPLNLLGDNYDRHIGRRHLDVGPGTGYFLQRAQVPADADVTLLDPNPNVLAHASRRLAHLNPVAVRADVSDPLLGGRSFDSAALNYVLHCLPGPRSRKAAAVGNVAAVLEPDGVLFGATILGEPHLHTRVGRAVLWDLNRKGVFDNRADTEEGLRSILAASFNQVAVEVVGSVAIFSARAPQRERQ
jgi:ubiquinone/menaquinone biosynthesis C-methylase UbiE